MMVYRILFYWSISWYIHTYSTIWFELLPLKIVIMSVESVRGGTQDSIHTKKKTETPLEN